MSTLFPEPKPPSGRGPCQWCGSPSVQRVEVTPPVFTASGGVKRLKHHAIEADVCAAHAAMIARNKAELEAAAEAKRRLRQQP